MLREKMHGVVAHIESGVRTLNQMQLRELVRMIGGLIMDLTDLKIKAESLLEYEDSDHAPKTQRTAPQPDGPETAPGETKDAETETVEPVA